MKKNPKKLVKTLFLLLLIGLSLLIFVPLGAGAVYGIITGLSEGVQAINWRDYTKPISQETADDLCAKFNIASDEPVCRPNAVVYGPEFYPYIIKAFCPEKDKCVTLAEVEEKIGKYRYSEAAQDALMPNESQRYWYDFQTDHMYPLIIRFFKDGTIKKIQYDFGD